MSKKRTNIIFSLTFVALLLIPLFFIDLQGGKISEEENRMLTARPSWSLLLESPTVFLAQFDGWFSDNVGFRGEMVHLYKQLDKLENGRYQLGHMTYLIGEQGHEYFDIGGILISKYQGKPFIPEENLTGLASGLNEMNEYLDEKDIPMIVMFCTDKETIYPEYYPKTIIRGPEPTQIDIITEYLQDNTDIDVFNIKQCLLDEKENYLLYNKAIDDVSHYNEIGAFFAYQELMRHINIYLPEIQPFVIDDFDISYNENGSPFTSLKHGESYEILDNDTEGLGPHNPNMWRNTFIENKDEDLPTILIFGDSCISPGFMDALPEHFSKTGLVHYEYIDHFVEFVDYYNPDIVVFESAEREIHRLAAYINDYYKKGLIDLG